MKKMKQTFKKHKKEKKMHLFSDFFYYIFFNEKFTF